MGLVGLLLALLVAHSRGSRPSATPPPRPVRRSADWSPTARPSAPSASRVDPCAAWTERARAAAVKPDGSPVTDDEMAQLLSVPRFLIPADIEQAVWAWSRAVGPPPAGCDSVWARRWRAWTSGG